MTDIYTRSSQAKSSASPSSHPFRAERYQATTKRLIDLLICAVLLPGLLPIIACLYLVARLDGGPAFFGHVRIGQNGRAFRCWKIRTMVVDAQSRLEALLESDPAAREEWERDRKLRNDPRVTPIGDFLRKTSLDELPQIWNVLVGEMSLVGPRPVTEPELERYGSQQRVYKALRPGITGLWQVSGRNDVSYSRRVALDSSYYADLSLAADLRILLRTAHAVMGRTGR